MLHKAWNSKGEVPYCFPKSSIKFQGHTGQNIIAFDPNWAFPDYRPVAAFKSLRFALLMVGRRAPNGIGHLIILTGRSWITGLAGISGLGPNSEPRGNNRSFLETRERACLPVKKIGSRDSIFGLVNSTYFLKITNHYQHALNMKHLANFIKKYWTCFRYQKLADFLVCFPPSVRVQVRWPPSWKICLMIPLSFGFWGRAVKAFDNFSPKLAWLLKTIF